ncbi:MAG: hypothetical protein QOJ74_810, partial [Ilumatobacteraceae bacterium]|nr:hypothetical protein [Ilumatobacteraceae bacterium]
AGSGRPTASNLNLVTGQTIPNMVIAKLGAGGQISIFNLAGSVDVVVDVLGWFPAGGSYTGLSPARLLDTRVLPPPPPVPPPPPPPPAPTFHAGTYAVNSQIQPGRYVAETAASGCYWERVSGFGGTIDEIIANDFQGFTGRVMVDILASDAGFRFTAGCGLLKAYVPAGNPVGTIVPGNHVVGQHILPGTYTTVAAQGCYWERDSSFEGTFEAVIANDYVSTAGSQFVTIPASDVGFYTDADCGTWTHM